MATLINRKDLPGNGTTYEFEGVLHGDVPVSFIITEVPPGKGPALHAHPYAEVFIMLQGSARFTAGEQILDAAAGQILIVEPGVPHAFVNTGTDVLRQVDIHTAPSFATEWLSRRPDGTAPSTG